MLKYKDMNHPLPQSVKKFFWGDDLTKINLKKHLEYISTTLLNSGDQESIHWLFSKIGKRKVSLLLPKLKLNPKSKNFWQLYLS